jgi:GGDEF domain-containing protein
MNLKRIREFQSHVGDAESLQRMVSKLAIFRVYDGVWYDENDVEISDSNTRIGLTSTIRRRKHWRRKNDVKAFFPLQPLDVVVVATFDAKPSDLTRGKVQRELDECLHNSLNACNATHDPLTALYNKAGFEGQLGETIQSSLLRDKPIATGNAEELSSARSIVLISLDIDFLSR